MAINLDVLFFDADACGRRMFYSEAVRLLVPIDDSKTNGPWQSLTRWARGLRARFKRSDGEAAKTGRKVWDWLHSRAHPDEALYSRLRRSRIITLHYPSTMTELEASGAWRKFLRAGVWRHVPWFFLNTAVAPATLFLAVFPGPNVVGYWFLYRAFHHFLILVGLARARMVTTRFVTSDALDPPITEGTDIFARADELQRAGLVRSPQQLIAFFKRQGVGARGAIGQP